MNSWRKIEDACALKSRGRFCEEPGPHCIDYWCEEPTHWKRPGCWERLKVGGGGDDRGWAGWMASLMSIELVMPSSHLILCHPLLLLPPIPPSIRVFSNESTLRMRGPKYWSFSFSISPSNEHPGLISSRMDWLDLLAVQVTLKSLLQHYSSKASIFGTQLCSQSNSHILTWPLE